MKAMASCHCEEIFQTPKFWAKARRKAPSAAPGMLPTPPIMIATTPIIRAFIPIVGVMSVSKEMRIPAMPARAEPMAKVKRITLSVSMPVTNASSGLAATARMVAPIRVYFIKAQQERSRKMDVTMITTCTVVIRAPRNSIPTDTSPVRNDLVSSPKMSEIKFCRII